MTTTTQTTSAMTTRSHWVRCTGAAYDVVSPAGATLTTFGTYADAKAVCRLHNGRAALRAAARLETLPDGGLMVLPRPDSTSDRWTPTARFDA